jgi:hypothetical protein
MLQDAGILITLTLRQWQARKLDRKTSLEVCQNKGAQTDSGNFHKVLISKQHLQPITQLVNKIRNYHYANTLAWSHKGVDFLPSKHYMTYMDKMGTLKDKFEIEVDKFVKIYPTLAKDTALELQSLYDADDYPSAEAVRERFFMDIAATPVPSSGDFRIDLPAKEMKKIKAKLDISLKESAHAAALDLYSRFYTSLAKTCLTLADPNKIFRNTLIFNVEDIAIKIKTMDITESLNLQVLAQDAHNVCNTIEIDSLRENIESRKGALKEFKQILALVEKAYEAFESKK